MKCFHCGAAVDRRAWFCSNCKRSVSRPVEDRSRAVRLVAYVVTGLALTAVAVSLLSSPRQDSQAFAGPTGEPVAPVVRVEPVPEPEPPRARIRVPATDPAALPPDAPAPPVAASPADREERSSGAHAAAAPAATGAVTVTTDAKVDTYVYLNGGTLLGMAPLREAAIPAGKHTLVFWAPAIGGRATRTVEVEPGATVTVVEKITPQERFAEGSQQ